MLQYTVLQASGNPACQYLFYSCDGTKHFVGEKGSEHYIYGPLDGSGRFHEWMVVVRELRGRVRNVVLIKCIFGSKKPKGGRDFGWEGT